MKIRSARQKLIAPVFAFAFASAMAVPAQNYSIEWYEITGGGGASTGGTYQISGTIGQPEAGNAMSGGQFSVTGGFWSLLAVVQAEGLPNLTITQAGHSFSVWWPNTVTCSLQQSTALAPANWVTCGYPVTTNNGVCCITITQPAGSLFFRLQR